MTFPVWIRSFEALVERRRRDPGDRLYYLGLYTSGPAHEAIKGFLMLNAPDAYQDAKQTLCDRYGNSVTLAETYRSKQMSWPTMKSGQDFLDFLKSCQTATESISLSLDSIDDNKRILDKLPNDIVNRWNRIVDTRIYEDRRPFPTFKEFVQFLTPEIRIRNSILKKKLDETEVVKQKATNRGAIRSFKSSINEVSKDSQAKPNAVKEVVRSTPSRQEYCVMCKENHNLVNCPRFKGMSLNDRHGVVKRHGLCRGCLVFGHMKHTYHCKLICSVCSGMHPTLLHDYSRKSDSNVNNVTPNARNNVVPNASNNVAQSVVSNNDVRAYCLNCYDENTQNVMCSQIVPVTVSLLDKSSKVYAMIDEQSDACFVSNNVLSLLHATSTSVQVKLSTVVGEQMVDCQKVCGLVVQGVNETTEIALPACYSRDAIPGTRDKIPKPDIVKKWSHLEKVADRLQPYDCNLEIGLLIGINCIRATKPREIITGSEDAPYAVYTALGWGIVGDTSVHDSNIDKSHFVFRTQVSEISPSQVANTFDVGFEEKATDIKMSSDDKRFLQKANDGIKHIDGHFELPLPFKDDPYLPDNRLMAERRLSGLNRRLHTDAKYRHDYTSFMDDLFDKGFAESVPLDDEPIDGKTWYIPHHAVYHPRKDKIRVVYDCSAEYMGDSLNKHLLQGPDMINNLTDILCRFRAERVALVCDIEGMFHQVACWSLTSLCHSMFHQVRVVAEHRNFLRFLWWKYNQLDTPPVDCRMTSHLFGARSSPGCVNFALKSAADLFENEFGSDAANFIRHNFYVDDGLTSVETSQEAINLIDNKGGFHLHKILSNDPDVIMSVPVGDRAKGVQKLDLSIDDLPVERTLGLQWCVPFDNFRFGITAQDKPVTRRGILSTINSVFSPLGLLAPFILKGKRILQELCMDGAGWDDPISDQMRHKWDDWCKDVKLLANLEIGRCYKPPGFGCVLRAELHHFCDASLEGLGQCSYLRLFGSDGQISTSLVMAKAKVPPKKVVTIPRLELQSAVISIKVSNFLSEELHYENITHIYYSDSRIVLGYIHNDAKRFHIFVANRVQVIRDRSSSPSDRRHISSLNNPADLASRGVGLSDLIASDLWWKGPPFLRCGESLPQVGVGVPLAKEDPEVRCLCLTCPRGHWKK